MLLGRAASPDRIIFFMSADETPELLVSVRSAAEAVCALAGGAALIDVKEPARGALGRADDAIIAEVVRLVGQRAPVSAALGELIEGNPRPACGGLAFVKWGLAGCRDRDWQPRLKRELVLPAPPQTVIVAYADWQCAQAPPVHDVALFACQFAGAVLLIDTHCKDTSPGLGRKPTLLDWLSLADLLTIASRCRAARVKVALAGSLAEADVLSVLEARPDWIGVRGAVCAGGARDGGIEVERVRTLVDRIAAGRRQTAACGLALGP
jgi:uncharacterized protein (UPF0264 family)